MKRLENKTAVIYGDGMTGSAMAKAFADAGAKVFFTGRTAAKLEAVREEVRSTGGMIETAQLDVLDKPAVAAHLKQVVHKAGAVHISYNAIGIDQKKIQSVPLVDLDEESFMIPISLYAKAHFITATAAASQMIRQGGGVILNHTPNASRISPAFSGGMIPAWAAIEALFRSLSVECGKSGVRTITLLTTAIPGTPLIQELTRVRSRTHGITTEEFYAAMTAQTHSKRLTTLKELTSAAIFVASDDGCAITGTILNLTSGVIVN